LKVCEPFKITFSFRTSAKAIYRPELFVVVTCDTKPSLASENKSQTAGLFFEAGIDTLTIGFPNFSHAENILDFSIKVL